MDALSVWAALLIGVAVTLLHSPPTARLSGRRTGDPRGSGRGAGLGTEPHPGGGPPERGQWWLHRLRVPLSLLCGCAAWVFLGGYLGGVAGLVAAGIGWRAIGAAVPESERRHRRELDSDLPGLVRLIGIGLRAGLAPTAAVQAAIAALPGAASEALQQYAGPIRLGADPGAVWRDLGRDPALGPLGTALSRAHDSGASVTVVIERLADDLARAGRNRAEDRARRVGVQAAVPLGLCMLPAFLLIGIVPVVAGLIGPLLA